VPSKKNTYFLLSIWQFLVSFFAIVKAAESKGLVGFAPICRGISLEESITDNANISGLSTNGWSSRVMARMVAAANKGERKDEKVHTLRS
jgi:hypothetical protein